MEEPNGLEIVAAINKLTANADDIDQDVLNDTLDSLNAALNDKLEATYWKITDNNRDLASMKVDDDAERARRNARKRTEKQNKSLEQYMISLIEGTGRTKIRTGKHIFRTVKNPPSVHINGPKQLPQDFMQKETTCKPNKNAIKEAIKAGHEIPGAELIQTKRMKVI